MLERVSRKLGNERDVVDPETHELSCNTAVDGLAHELKNKLPAKK